MRASEEIPKELKELVSSSVKLLGHAIQKIYGTELYGVIEALRHKMKSVRAQDANTVHAAMETVYLSLKNENTEDLHKVAKAFSLMLELINSCEAAYRSYRLADQKIETGITPSALVYVFTSHPTEARSPEFLYLTDKIQKLLIEALNDGFSAVDERLLHFFQIALRINLANNRRPQVKDEAEQIFHTVMDESILMEQIDLKKKGVEVYFRTWVGGDKDGHPKVGPATMLQSFNLSRGKILFFINKRIAEFTHEISILDTSKRLQKQVAQVNAALRALKKVGANDGRKVKTFKQKLNALKKLADQNNLLSPHLKDLENLLWIYPAMVLPLEIREDHDFIHAALKKPSLPIARMLVLLKKISIGLDAKWYVRGFVVSMCQSSEDLIAAAKLTRKMCGSFTLPVVPLFENEKGLSNAVKILSESYKAFAFKQEHHKRWGGRFEVMLGYSDSSKENGVFPGRLLVEKALLELDEFIQKQGMTPVFFHGSGGSVSRGGGSIKEQIAWLPQSALNIYKVTVQGETVQRNFNQPQIMRSQVNKIVEEFAKFKPRKKIQSGEINQFASAVQDSYKDLVQDTAFQEVATLATPYDFLNLLKIGSRPTKRSGKGKFTLRAIPWILCWTQTRLLLPIWWGVGSAWEQQSKEERKAIIDYYKQSPLMQSFIKNLGFTLAKMELGVWKFQLEHSGLKEEQRKQWFDKMELEVEKTMAFFEALTGGKDLTWFNHRLGQSIIFRSSMIHPLNIIQKISLERKDNSLLRETVTGIACGMLTTG
ncbi:MAG TPA: phosphoenolpyruvate carboxylase [Bacteriovoracaceae bacterium]|nr:phosphoenolpyruvate carboxylase [Bacteriovoracaceae bacterium]